MDQEKVQKLVESYQKCVAFANMCQERVMLLEAYKSDADAAITLANEQVVVAGQELDSERRKSKFLYPTVALVLGFVVGFFVVK